MPPQGWEYVGPELLRMPVPSGWIYRLRTGHGADAICFVPSPQLLGGVNPPVPRPAAASDAAAPAWPGPEDFWP